MKVCSKCLIILFLLSSNLYADVKMPSFFGDNMVVQRDIPLNVWGWASPGEKVTVSFAGQGKTATTDGNGKWIVKLDPLKASKESFELIVSSSIGNQQLKIKNVLVGDVWVCSGQSNMQMAVEDAANAKDEVASSKNPLVRHIAINYSISLYPQDDVPSSKFGWTVAGPQTTGKIHGGRVLFCQGYCEGNRRSHRLDQCQLGWN